MGADLPYSCHAGAVCTYNIPVVFEENPGHHRRLTKSLRMIYLENEWANDYSYDPGKA